MTLRETYLRPRGIQFIPVTDPVLLVIKNPTTELVKRLHASWMKADI